MKSMYFKGRAVSDESSKVCILYDPRDGRVVHVHGVTALQGGRSISEDELEQRAKSRAAAIGRSVSGLKTLHLPISEIPHGMSLTVNSEGTGLVPATQSTTDLSGLLAKYRAT